MSTLEHRLLWMMLARMHEAGVVFDQSDMRDPVGEITVKWLPNGEVQVTAEPAEEPAPEVPTDDVVMAKWFREHYRRPNRLPKPLPSDAQANIVWATHSPSHWYFWSVPAPEGGE